MLGARDKAAISDVLERPHGIAVRQGKVYVCDHQGGDVKVLNLARKTHALLSGARRILAGPTNLCIDKDGYTFVVESMRNLIQVSDPQDNYLTTFRVKDGRPGGIAVVGSDLRGTHSIGLVFDGALATADGGLHNPDTKATPLGGTITKDLLFGTGNLDCASCHDVHNTRSAGNPALVRITINGSALCLTCHNK